MNFKTSYVSEFWDRMSSTSRTILDIISFILSAISRQ